MLIGTRSFKLRTETVDTQFTVRVFMPEEKEGSWWCQYEIEWPSGKKASAAAGADSIQSIILALQKIGVEIYASDGHKSDSLTWFGPGQGYGFPVAANVRDLLVGDDANL